MVMELKQFDFDGCMKEGLLRSVPPSKEKADSSIRAADKWIEEAEKSMNVNAFNSSVLSSYLAMFHAARSILFFDGFREKSHYCIARYLEEKYAKKKLLEIRWIELLDHYRELRHNSQYDVSFITSKDEAKTTIETAKHFVSRMKELMKKKTIH
jgi:uncharacterized protein (UPF0332 family)